MHDGACFVAGASVPARASFPLPPRQRSVCQHECVSQHTLRAGAQHSGRRETRVRRKYTSQIITDGVPTHTTTLVHPNEKEACVKLRSITTHITCRCTTKRSTPPRERSVCQDACVSQHTLRAGAQHSVRRETRVRRRYTSQIVTDLSLIHI